MKNNYSKIKYAELTINQINLSLFSTFDRHQDVKKCWRKEDVEMEPYDCQLEYLL